MFLPLVKDGLQEFNVGRIMHTQQRCQSMVLGLSHFAQLRIPDRIQNDFSPLGIFEAGIQTSPVQLVGSTV